MRIYEIQASMVAFNVRLVIVNVFLLLIYTPQSTSRGLIKFRHILMNSTAHTCCVGLDQCKKRCRITLDICLRAYQSHVCLIRGRTREITSNGDIEVEFSSMYKGVMSLRLAGFKRNSSDRIFTVDDEQRIAFSNATWKKMLYQTQSVYFSVEFKLSCKKHLYGKVCERHCKPRNNTAGHFRCDEMGRRICLPGWEKPEYSCLKETCLLCVHGKCEHKICYCDKGWTGSSCNVDLTTCFTRPCFHNGTCTDEGKCDCLSGYYGGRCENSFAQSIHSVNSERIVPTASRHNHLTLNVQSTTISLKQQGISSTMFKLSSSSCLDPFKSRHSCLSVQRTDQPTTSKTSNIAISVSITLAMIAVLLAIGAFFVLCQRSKSKRRRNQTSVLSPNNNFTTSMKQGGKRNYSISSTASITPILDHFCDNDSGTGSSLPYLDGISSNINFPVDMYSSLEQCSIEAVQPPFRQKTFHLIKEKKRPIALSHSGSTTSQVSSGYCSSGYSSSSASPAPHSTSLKKSLLSQFFPTDADLSGSFLDNNHNDKQNVASFELRESSIDSRQRHVFPPVKFEELPNFVCYHHDKEDVL